MRSLLQELYVFFELQNRFVFKWDGQIICLLDLCNRFRIAQNFDESSIRWSRATHKTGLAEFQSRPSFVQRNPHVSCEFFPEHMPIAREERVTLQTAGLGNSSRNNEALQKISWGLYSKSDSCIEWLRIILNTWLCIRGSERDSDLIDHIITGCYPPEQICSVTGTIALL